LERKKSIKEREKRPRIKNIGPQILNRGPPDKKVGVGNYLGKNLKRGEGRP